MNQPIINPPPDAIIAGRMKKAKLLAWAMLFLAIAGPALGPVLFKEEFQHMSQVGRDFYYVSSFLVFGLLSLMNLFLYHRIRKRSAGKAVDKEKHA